MTKILNSRGQPVSADDPTRLIWYSALCTYWTDDWDKLSKLRGRGDGIPCCPKCFSVGFQVEAQKWMEGAEGFQKENHPRYVEFLTGIKETCVLQGALLKAYRNWFSLQQEKEVIMVWTDKCTFMRDGQVMNKSLLPEEVREEVKDFEFYLLDPDEVLACGPLNIAVCHPSNLDHMSKCPDCTEFWNTHPLFKEFVGGK